MQSSLWRLVQLGALLCWEVYESGRIVYRNRVYNTESVRLPQGVGERGAS
jgi:hypothetical protein